MKNLIPIFCKALFSYRAIYSSKVFSRYIDPVPETIFIWWSWTMYIGSDASLLNNRSHITRIWIGHVAISTTTKNPNIMFTMFCCAIEKRLWRFNIPHTGIRCKCLLWFPVYISCVRLPCWDENHQPQISNIINILAYYCAMCIYACNDHLMQECITPLIMSCKFPVVMW